MPEEDREKMNTPTLNHGKLRIERNGYFKSKSYIFSIGNNDLLKATSMSIVHTGSFNIEAKDTEVLSSLSSLSTLSFSRKTSDWRVIGNVNSPGILFDRSIVKDFKKNTKAAIIYNNTSRTGDLMNMKVIIPRVYKQSEKRLISTILKSTCLPKDCAQLIVKYCNLFWTESISKNINSSNCHKLIDNKSMNNKIIIMRNKLPSWNAQINAYTLEFGGRALVPSVHNFQLIVKDKEIVLQLGKVSEFEFNIDFSFPLSPYQAFCICLSVIDRTFVWD